MWDGKTRGGGEGKFKYLPPNIPFLHRFIVKVYYSKHHFLFLTIDYNLFSTIYFTIMSGHNIEEKQQQQKHSVLILKTGLELLW